MANDEVGYNNDADDYDDIITRTKSSKNSGGHPRLISFPSIDNCYTSKREVNFHFKILKCNSKIAKRMKLQIAPDKPVKILFERDDFAS